MRPELHPDDVVPPETQEVIQRERKRTVTIGPLHDEVSGDVDRGIAVDVLERDGSSLVTPFRGMI
ncbi:hypothetical protein CcI49_37315 [Frankia sp. CcI49]|nr:hypothetical protein CcI49_37315 [Frankia sp. CcI49]